MFIVFFVVGFFILLGIVLKGETNAPVAKNDGNTQVAGQKAPIPDAVPQDIQIAEITDEDWILGNTDAKISIVEFSDIECPFCKRFHPTIQRIVDEYPNDVNWVYRHFPLPSLHPNAPKDAEASECAGEQGGNEGFWEYLDTIINTELTGTSQLKDIAQELGLNTSQFNECLDSGKYANKVTTHSNYAQAAGARGTPYSVIISGDQKIAIPGALPYEQVKGMIDSLL